MLFKIGQHGSRGATCATCLWRIKLRTSFEVHCVLAILEAVTNYCALSFILLCFCSLLLQRHYLAS